MLRMFLGKPGGGKSSGALRDIVDELVHGHRIVVTNLSIDPGRLNEFIQRRFPDADVDLHKRLLLLDEKQSRRFWLYRGPGVVVPDVTRDEEKSGKFPDFGAYAGEGCLFVIDEAHVMFDARAWMESGPSLTYYNSQHRKLNDELVFVTQFLELIDKRVRGFAQEYWYFRNNGMEKLFTFFVLPKYFTVRVYQRPPTGMNDLPSEIHRYRLDLEMAQCYDTSAGIGIKGRQRPEKVEKRGLHIGWLTVPAAIALYLFWAAPDWAGKAIAGTDTGARLATTAGVVESGSGELAGSYSRSDPIQRSDGSEGPRVAAVVEAHPTGYVSRRGRITVVMSDGTTRTERDVELEQVERNSVTLAGRKIFIRSRSDGVSHAGGGEVRDSR